MDSSTGNTENLQNSIYRVVNDAFNRSSSKRITIGILRKCLLQGLSSKVSIGEGNRASLLNNRTLGSKQRLPSWHEEQTSEAIPEYKRLRAQAKNGRPSSTEGLAEALANALQIRHSSDRATSLQECLRQWITVDPESALKHCQDLVERSHRHEAIHAWARQLGMDDPDKVLALLEDDIPPGSHELLFAFYGLGFPKDWIPPKLATRTSAAV